MVAHAAALTAEDTDAMGFIDHDGGVVLMLQADDFGQVGQVAFHGKYAIHHDELDGVFTTTLELALEVFHVVVLILECRRERQTTAVHYRCMVAVVADDIVFAPCQASDHAGIDTEAGGEAQTFVFSHKLGQFFLQLHVQVKRSVKET